MIDTPSVDWFALSPSLATLGAAAICLLSGAFVPSWILRPFAAFFCALGFMASGALAILIYIETPHGSLEVADADDPGRAHARPVRRGGCGGQGGEAPDAHEHDRDGRTAGRGRGQGRAARPRERAGR